MAGSVKSGDPDNLEAQAARIYWPLMMGEDFRRNPDAPGPNALLNYGYAVLRSAVSRAIVAAGLHPGLGIFHHHPLNAMPLADDLMEPFRPLMDVAACKILQEGITSVTPAAKHRLVESLVAEHAAFGATTPLSTVIIRAAASLAESFLLRKAALQLPVPVFSPTKKGRLADGTAVH